MDRMVETGEARQTVPEEAGRTDALIVIPAYNEAATIGSVVLEALTVAEEVLVVDDGSTDATAELAAAAGARVLRHDTNRGKGMAIENAFQYARENNWEYLVLVDGDWQHRPKEADALLTACAEGPANIVIGSRYLDGNRGETALYRRVGQRVLDGITEANTGYSVTDSQSGFRAFDRTAIETVAVTDAGFGVESQMLESASERSLTVTEVPISVNYDVPDPNTSNPVRHGFSVAVRLLRTGGIRYPRFFLGAPGAVLAAVGFVGVWWTVTAEATWTLSLVIGLLLSTLLCLCGVVLTTMSVRTTRAGRH
ncbi:glycosyltransferase family 2 protein [Halopelagius fulvigenes]|uniref:Glycosyltransferase family 2 protein n=1 Tax=Halopelagius fulvigenes TaxID=1198324 RepID=A0ABD5TXN6_9EURY